MAYKYKNFEGTNNKTIEIVSSESALKLLKRSGNENIIVCLPLLLHIGKLDSLTPFNRQELSKYYAVNHSFNFNDDFNKLKEIVNNCIKIRVWSSHLDSDDYCLLLLICYLFHDKNISVIFSDESDLYALTITALSEKEICDLKKREHILTKLSKDDYCNQWKKIVKENKELRYMVNGVVISCDVDYFKREIIDRLEKSGKTYLFRLITNLMTNPPIPNISFPDIFYKYLIERLEKEGIIKSFIIDGKKYVELNQ